jgi:hypothetical protein
MESSQKPEFPLRYDVSKMRPEDVIRDDLRQQLEAIHQRYLTKWVWGNAGRK